MFKLTRRNFLGGVAAVPVVRPALDSKEAIPATHYGEVWASAAVDVEYLTDEGRLYWAPRGK